MDSGLKDPCALAVDGERVYWSTAGKDGAIGCVPLDGGPVVVLATGQDGPTHLIESGMSTAPLPKKKNRYRGALRVVQWVEGTIALGGAMNESNATHDVIQPSTQEVATMKWVLWLNTIGETLIAVGMFSMPASFFPGAEGLSAAIARAFSFAILAVAFISFSATAKATTRETEKNVVGILVFYHVMQLIAQFVNAAMHPPLLVPPVIIHICYSSLFIVYAVKLRNRRDTRAVVSASA